MFWFLQIVFIKTPWEGCQTTIHCAIDPSVENHSGAYYSDCQLKHTTKKAMDPTLAEDLWIKTEQLIDRKT